MARKTPVIAIVGRTNVGKSTLFNAIAARRVAVVEDTPGVTRDRNYLSIHRYSFPFELIDTGGLVGEEDSGLVESVQAQARIAIAQADLVLAVFDGIAGPAPHDSDVIDLLRRAGKPVLWVINKCEKPLTAELAAEFYELGLDDLHFVSAAHRIGIHELMLEAKRRLKIGDEEVFEESQSLEGVIRIAILGKPNVGKSTLVNKILGEDRVIAADLPGTTRDSIDVPLTRDGQRYILVDTAGLRRKARVEDGTPERYSNLRTLKSLVRADVAVLMLDATEGLPSDQDAKIAGIIHERGKSLIIVVNKWDLVEKDHRTVHEYSEAIYATLKFARYAPILFVSALTGRRLPSVLDMAKELYAAARVRVPTAELNRILSRAFATRPPAVYRGQPIKLFFAVQVDVAPPTIVLFLNYPKRLGFAYERFLRNELRKEFPFAGVDIKMELRKRTEKAQAARDRREGQGEGSQDT